MSQTITHTLQGKKDQGICLDQQSGPSVLMKGVVALNRKGSYARLYWIKNMSISELPMMMLLV